MNMNIKTKLTYGIGLLFVLITLLGGLAIKNIHNVSDDTQNILADNYNSLLYSRQMLESLDAIRENPNLQRQVTGGFVAQQSRDLTNKVTELLGAGLFVAQDADLVLQQRMLNDHRGHKNTLLIFNRSISIGYDVMLLR